MARILTRVVSLGKGTASAVPFRTNKFRASAPDISTRPQTLKPSSFVPDSLTRQKNRRQNNPGCNSARRAARLGPRRLWCQLHEAHRPSRLPLKERNKNRGLRTKFALQASKELVVSGKDSSYSSIFILRMRVHETDLRFRAIGCNRTRRRTARRQRRRKGRPLTRILLSAILSNVGAKYLPAGATRSEARAFLVTLRVEELALARACAAGNNSAWEIFLTRYREKLYQSALRIAAKIPLHASLPTVYTPTCTARDTRRRTRFEAGVVHGTRIARGLAAHGVGAGICKPLSANQAAGKPGRRERRRERIRGARARAGSAPIHAWNRRPTTALASLSGEDRMVLAAYYLDGRTLAEIARMLGVHESTISRKVDKLAKSLRKKILAGMIQQGMSRRQAEEALDVDVRDLRLDIRRSLAQESPAAAFSEKKETSSSRQSCKLRAKSGEPRVRSHKCRTFQKSCGSN